MVEYVVCVYKLKLETYRTYVAFIILYVFHVVNYINANVRVSSGSLLLRFAQFEYFQVNDVKIDFASGNGKANSGVLSEEAIGANFPRLQL